mgnify:CR=1 FL=1
MEIVAIDARGTVVSGSNAGETEQVAGIACIIEHDLIGSTVGDACFGAGLMVEGKKARGALVECETSLAVSSVI